MADIERLLDVEDAAITLGLKPATIRRMTRRGELPFVRPTGRRAVRYRERDLRALLTMRSEPMRAPGTQAPVSRKAAGTLAGRN